MNKFLGACLAWGMLIVSVSCGDMLEETLAFAQKMGAVVCKGQTNADIESQLNACVTNLPADCQDKHKEMMTKRGEFCNGDALNFDKIKQQITDEMSKMTEEQKAEMMKKAIDNKAAFEAFGKCVMAIQI